MGDADAFPSSPRPRDGEVPAEPATTGAAAPTTSAVTTLVARSSVEAFLWVFVTRLIALLTAGRTASATTVGADAAGASDSPTVDPARARRVAASRGDAAAAAPTIPPASTPVRTADDRARTVAITTATAVAGAAAAFALGHRRGRR